MQIQQIDLSKLSEYAKVSIAFEVKTKLQICPINNGLGGLQLVERPCRSYVKDYDLLPDCHPLSWKKQFDLDAWGLFIALENDIYVGGAAVAPEMAGFKRGAANLWDLRVQPDARNKGIGGKLLEAVRLWSKERGYRTLMVETQNVNTPACKFYSNKGFVLETIDLHGYGESLVEDEAKLMWYMDI
ncbi:GNAT family N-acetyltransferase [Halobacillus sp. Marseille-Q1614]|uniref:GNAT family N-acetyltransferase n=1 Tax=Halobacillus sp. Marseille-Q1614 TaxID=2709134 RepID=UPI00156E1D6A|nr:GNAT family N-acetyltransferase [Halobacillus sp. Marseille-Q1614]